MNVCGMWLDGFPRDCITVNDSFSFVQYNTIIDTLADNSAHRDAVQLIPSGVNRAQYAASLLSDVAISNNHIRSNGALQGIFCSDGLLQNINVIDNVIETAGRHYITLSGLLSGRIERNVTRGGVPCPVLLMPLRIGGNSGGTNLYVVSFSGSDIDYAPIEDIADYETIEVTRDYRRGDGIVNGVCLREFDLIGFNTEISRMPVARDVIEHCADIKRVAMMFGRLL